LIVFLLRELIENPSMSKQLKVVAINFPAAFQTTHQSQLFLVFQNRKGAHLYQFYDNRDHTELLVPEALEI